MDLQERLAKMTDGTVETVEDGCLVRFDYWRNPNSLMINLTVSYLADGYTVGKESLSIRGYGAIFLKDSEQLHIELIPVDEHTYHVTEKDLA